MSTPTFASILHRNLRVWLLLLALLGLTLALAFVPMGVGNSVCGLLIAALKATLVALLFMELREQHALPRLAALAALFWLAILFVLTLADLLPRLPLQQLQLG